MSIRTEMPYTCPRCGHTQEWAAWQYLNVRDDSAEKPNAVSGAIFDFTCEKCGESFRVGYPMVYHDPEKKLIVIMTMERSSETALQMLRPLRERELIGPQLKGYTVRAVMQAPQLSEKIVASDAGLDDRAIEVCKLLVWLHWKSTHDGHAPDRIHLVKQDKLYFLLLIRDEIALTELPMGMYGSVMEEYAGFFPQRREDTLFIDSEWTAGLLREQDRLQ